MSHSVMPCNKTLPLLTLLTFFVALTATYSIELEVPFPPPCATGIAADAPWSTCTLATTPTYDPLTSTSVSFSTSDNVTQALFSHAESCEANNTVQMAPGEYYY